MSSIEGVSAQALRSEQQVREQTNRRTEAPKPEPQEDAVVVSVESRVTDEAAAFDLAQSISTRITERDPQALEAQDPEPRSIQDLLA
ncbi:MAG: hypothetical protein KDD69_07845 [Bdellovibrionales bacterium]|nr:hypothetical protein [Bdellovibrionales bacterium]